MYPKYRLTLVNAEKSTTQRAKMYDGYGLVSDGTLSLANTAKSFARIAGTKWSIEAKLRPLGRWVHVGGNIPEAGE